MKLEFKWSALALASLGVLWLSPCASAQYNIISQSRGVGTNASGEDASGPQSNNASFGAPGTGTWVKSASSSVSFNNIACFPFSSQNSTVSSSVLKGSGHSDANANIYDPEMESAHASAGSGFGVTFTVATSGIFEFSAGASRQDHGNAQVELYEDGILLYAVYAGDFINSEPISMIAGKTYDISAYGGASALVGNGSYETFSAGGGDWSFELIQTVPEPASIIALGLGVGLVAKKMRRR